MSAEGVSPGPLASPHPDPIARLSVGRVLGAPRPLHQQRALAAIQGRARHAPRGTPAAEVDRWILRLATDPEMRAWMDDALTRMGRYEPLIRESLRRYSQPEDLIVVAVVESQFRPGAVSPAGATGLWQFMSGTGRLYQLEVSPFVDERRDPIRSTDAAVRHLRDLHAEFGSWHLALAAYNAGSGRVARALNGTGGGSDGGGEGRYWQIRPSLPRETRRYVPLFLAAAEIARHPKAYGFAPRHQEPLRFSEAQVPGGVTLESVARRFGVATADVLELNPHLVRQMTPPGRTWPVRLPVSDSRPYPKDP